LEINNDELSIEIKTLKTSLKKLDEEKKELSKEKNELDFQLAELTNENEENLLIYTQKITSLQQEKQFEIFFFSNN